MADAITVPSADFSPQPVTLNCHQRYGKGALGKLRSKRNPKCSNIDLPRKGCITHAVLCNRVRSCGFLFRMPVSLKETYVEQANLVARFLLEARSALGLALCLECSWMITWLKLTVLKALEMVCEIPAHDSEVGPGCFSCDMHFDFHDSCMGTRPLLNGWEAMPTGSFSDSTTVQGNLQTLCIR